MSYGRRFEIDEDDLKAEIAQEFAAEMEDENTAENEQAKAAAIRYAGRQRWRRWEDDER